jgi:Ca-activated chloride channel family protein
VDLVEVYATVTDDKGKVVTNLTRDDFDVLEDGARQEITAFTGGEFPLAAAVAIDHSFSMGTERLAAAKSAARIFLGALRPADEAMVVAVGSEITAVTPLSTDRRAQFAAVDALGRWGTTALHDAIIEAINAIQPARSRPPLFSELAALTGGRSAHLRDARGLPQALRDIASELRHQYLLGYTPKRPLDDVGEWRAITVRVKRPGWQVRARDGYLVR